MKLFLFLYLYFSIFLFIIFLFFYLLFFLFIILLFFYFSTFLFFLYFHVSVQLLDQTTACISGSINPDPLDINQAGFPRLERGKPLPVINPQLLVAALHTPGVRGINPIWLCSIFGSAPPNPTTGFQNSQTPLNPSGETGKSPWQTQKSGKIRIAVS